MGPDIANKLKAFWYMGPDIANKLKAFLVHGTRCCQQTESHFYIPWTLKVSLFTKSPKFCLGGDCYTFNKGWKPDITK